MKIVAHTMVKNEEKWIWFSLLSAIDLVDEIMVWDTGSSDKTVNILNSISSSKLKLKYFKLTTPLQHTQVRQRMLDETDSDWVMILDGDEIWPPDALKESLNLIKTQGKNLDFIISPYRNLLGDVYHYQDELAGRYQIGRHRGHITIRFFNLKRLAPLTYEKGYPEEGIKNRHGVFLQSMPLKHVVKAKLPYLHCTHLERSSSLSGVISRSAQKIELGHKFPASYPYPASFYLPRPDLVSDPWEIKRIRYSLNSYWQTPLKLLKRRLPL